MASSYAGHHLADDGGALRPFVARGALRVGDPSKGTLDGRHPPPGLGECSQVDCDHGRRRGHAGQPSPGTPGRERAGIGRVGPSSGAGPGVGRVALRVLDQRTKHVVGYGGAGNYVATERVTVVFLTVR